VLAGFDIFTIWWLVVLAFGCIVLTKRKASEVVPPALAAGIVWIVVTAVLNKD
jgi:hypothetical protein